MTGARVALHITIAACSLGVFACLFAAFADTGESFFETYARLDVFMALMCLALIVIPILAAAGVARAKLDRVTIGLACVPFAFFGAFVALEYWGEIEPGSYVAALFSTLAAACALGLCLMASPAAAAAGPDRTLPAAGPGASVPASQPRPSGLPPAGWYPDPAGTHGRRYWDGATWTAQTD